MTNFHFQVFMMFLEMALLLKSFQIILWLPLHKKKDQEVEDLLPNAAEQNSKECLEALLSHGAEVNMRENVSHDNIADC